jgi:serine/threonine-protein kinase RsbW
VRLLLEHNQIVVEDIDDVELIVGELCANVIRHAYDHASGRYAVEAALDGAELCISVSDSGRGFDSAALPEEPQFTAAGGMGFFLMNRFSDRMRFHAVDGGGSAIVAHRSLRAAPREEYLATKTQRAGRAQR